LLSSNCRSTSVDDDWVAQLIDLRTEPPKSKTRTYVHLMRAAGQMFEPAELGRLAPRARTPHPRPLPHKGGGETKLAPSQNGGGENKLPPSPLVGEGSGVGGTPTDPLVLHENIAYDWLMQGGKRSRPFITLAAYDALKGGAATLQEDVTLPNPVRRTALAIEAFHKAS